MNYEQGIFKMRIWDVERKVITDDENWLMEIGKLDPRMGFESVGLQADGTAIVCDKCGNFGYLDDSKVKLIIGYGP